MGGADVGSTAAEVTAILDGAVAATDLPVTRRSDPPGLLLPCDAGGRRVTMTVNADDPPDLEGLHERLVAHLVDTGWQRTTDLPIDGAGGQSLSVFLERDGFQAVADLVRGTEGTGVDLEVLSPCRDLPA